MKQNLILEEINRFRLLSSYNSKMTLTENMMKSELAEVTGKQLLQLLGFTDEAAATTALANATSKAGKVVSAELTAARNLLDDVIKNEGTIQLQLNRTEKALMAGKTTLTSADEILTALSNGLIKGEALNKVMKGLLKGGKVSGPLRKQLTDNAAALSIKKGTMSNAANKTFNLSEISRKQIKDLLKQKGFADDVADEIAVKIKDGLGSKTAKTADKVDDISRAAKPADKVDDISRARDASARLGRDANKIDDGVWASTQGTTTNITLNQNAWNILRLDRYRRWMQAGRTSWKTIYPYLIGAGVGGLLTALLYGLFSNNGQKYFPPCIGGSIMLNPEALKKTAEMGLNTNQAVMMDKNHPPLMNAIVTSTVDGQSGTMKLADGTEATYQQKTDDKGKNVIEVKDNTGSTIYIIDCSNKIEVEVNPTPAPVPPIPVPSGCAPASDFPFGYYQTNSKVLEVQQCVGADPDSCMGPQTARMINSYLGLGSVPTSLTKDIYDKVKAKCGGGTKTTTNNDSLDGGEWEGGSTSDL